MSIEWEFQGHDDLGRAMPDAHEKGFAAPYDRARGHAAMLCWKWKAALVKFWEKGWTDAPFTEPRREKP